MKVKAYFTRTAVFIKEIELPDGSDVEDADTWPLSSEVWDELDRKGLSLDGEPENGYLDDAEIDHVEMAPVTQHVHPAPDHVGGPWCKELA